MDTLKIIKANTEFPIVLPWNGKEATFIIRMLNSTQIKSCGEFSTIVNLEYSDELTFDEIFEVKQMQERLARLTLVSPTYDEIIGVLYDSTLIESIKEKLKLAKEEIQVVESVEHRDLLVKELEAYELYLGFLLPDDFMAALTATVLQRDNSDIRKVTRDMLLEAAILAERGKDNPADHIQGDFTDFHREDINKYAWNILEEYRDDQKTAKAAWIRNPRKRRHARN